jgi:hypothetical protein
MLVSETYAHFWEGRVGRLFTDLYACSLLHRLPRATRVHSVDRRVSEIPAKIPSSQPSRTHKGKKNK